MKPVAHWDIADTAFAVVDLETTGFAPGRDRVVEIAVVNVTTGGEVRLEFDSLIDPERPMEGIEIHGITQTQADEAPRFFQVASHVLDRLHSAVIVGHNVEFDMRFIHWEFRRIGFDFVAPYLDTMSIRSALQLGGRATLDEACEDEGIHRMDRRHSAAVDAIDTAKLLASYLGRIRSAGRPSRIGDLVVNQETRAAESLNHTPIAPQTHMRWPTDTPSRSRFERRGATELDLAYRTYFQQLLGALSDLEVDESEAGVLAEVRVRLGISEGAMRSLHAQAYAGAIMQFVADKTLNQAERDYLRRLRKCLSNAGWAPGD